MLSFVLAVSKKHNFGKHVIIIVIIIMDDEDYARCSLYYFWCNSDMCSLSDCVKMWTTLCFIHMQYQIEICSADFLNGSFVGVRRQVVP